MDTTLLSLARLEASTFNGLKETRSWTLLFPFGSFRIRMTGETVLIWSLRLVYQAAARLTGSAKASPSLIP